MDFDFASLMDQIEALQALQALTPEQFAFIAVFYGGQIAAGLFALRTICVVVGRQFGVITPSAYARFPRVPWRTVYKAYLTIKKCYERIF